MGLKHNNKGPVKSHRRCDDQNRIRVRDRLENAIPWALMLEEGAMSQGMQATSTH